MNDLAKLTADLVRIESINPSLDPSGSGEADVAGFVAEWLANAGFEVHLQESAPDRPNVIGIRRGTGGGRSLMLNAHMDTVSLGGYVDGLDARIEGNLLYGRGSYDMKSCLAACMMALKDLDGDALAGDVILTAVTDEEYASIGTQAIVQEYRADACIITEPSHMELCLAHKGFVWATIETHGLAAHGSLCEAGIDAIARMGPMLTGLGELDRRLRAGARHPLVGTGSIHASLIDGGTELSTYPDRCRVQIERRTIPGETDVQIVDQLRALIAGTDATLTMGINRAPFEISPETEIAALAGRVAGAVLGQVPDVVGWGGWMDSALTSAAGIPTIVYGPTGAGAHADIEWIEMDTVQQCREIYAAIAREWCA